MRISITVAVSTLIAGGIAQAGTWSVSSTYLFGSGTGTSGPLYRAFNSVNGQDISNGTHYFASSTTGSSMVSGVSNPGATSADAQAATSGASILYTFTYSPNGKTDSPGLTLTVSLALARQQSVSGNTANDYALISAYAKVMGDGIQFPDLTGDAVGQMVSFGPPAVDETIVLVKTLNVDHNEATLIVTLKTETQALFTISQDGLGGGGGDAPQAEVNAQASITPSTSFLNIVLVTPPQGIYPSLNPPYVSDNKYVFDSASPGVLQNPDWRSEVVGGSPSAFLSNTTYTSFTIPGSTRTNDTISISGSVIRQRFTYTGLPSSNSSFGDKEVVMTCTSPVSTTQRSFVRVFFTKLATNHPVNPDAPYHLSATPTPNWFYYWYQTPAFFGQCKYYPGSGSGSCSFSPTVGTWVALVHDGGAWGPAGANGQRWGAATGIDFFA